MAGGVYIFNPLASVPVVITNPHIADDFFILPVSLELYRESDAYAYMASGVGRETLYDESNGYYSNSFSLCDPSRQEDTMFNKVYQASCDFLRETFSHRELSIQVHSYDWNRHLWYPNCQISAGWEKVIRASRSGIIRFMVWILSIRVTRSCWQPMKWVFTQKCH